MQSNGHWFEIGPALINLNQVSYIEEIKREGSGCVVHMVTGGQFELTSPTTFQQLRLALGFPEERPPQ